MTKYTLLSLFLLLMLSVPLQAMELAGITMPDSLENKGKNLVLNGAGTRTKFFLKLYVGGLYLAERSQDGGGIIEADSPMTLRLHITSSAITSKKMETATREGFYKATQGNPEPIQQKIEQFISVFQDSIKENDIYSLAYSPEKGVEVFKNGALHSTITGLPFKQALFAIWLGAKPAQESLKKKMLAL